MLLGGGAEDAFGLGAGSNSAILDISLSIRLYPRAGVLWCHGLSCTKQQAL